MAETFFFFTENSNWVLPMPAHEWGQRAGCWRARSPWDCGLPGCRKGLAAHSGDARTRLRSHQLCVLPSAVMLHEAERHSQSLGAGLPLHKENCEIVGEPPLPDLPNRAMPNLPGLPPKCWPLWPPCPMASPLHRADLREGMAREQGSTREQESSWAFTLKH